MIFGGMICEIIETHKIFGIFKITENHKKSADKIKES